MDISRYFEPGTLIKVSVDREKAKSILAMASIMLKRTQETDKLRYSSLIIRDYYEIIRELTSILILLDGYKIIGEEAHKKHILYLEISKELSKEDILLVDELRIIRNKVSYDGFFVREDYLKRKEATINQIIQTLYQRINEKLTR